MKTGSEGLNAVIDPTTVVNGVPDDSSFSGQLSKAVTAAITEVNALQNISVDSQTEFQMGGDIPLTEVVMNMQKASLAMEATIQVRNKVLTAYQEILNMPI